MKALYLLSSLIIAAFCYYHFSGGDRLGQLSLSGLISGVTNSEIRLVDRKNRSIDCIIQAKQNDFFLISRVPDGQRYLLNLNQLSANSRSRVDGIRDFKENAMDAFILNEALDSITVEVLYLPGTNTIKRHGIGNEVKSHYGHRLEQLCEYLNKQNIEYNLRSVRTSPINANYVYLETGVRTVPCIKIGNHILYNQNTKMLNQYILDAYYTQLRAQTHQSQ